MWNMKPFEFIGVLRTTAGLFSYLLGDLLSLEREHFLLLIGVIDYVLPPNQEFALHGLRNKKYINPSIIDAGRIFCLQLIMPSPSMAQPYLRAAAQHAVPCTSL